MAVSMWIIEMHWLWHKNNSTFQYSVFSLKLPLRTCNWLTRSSAQMLQLSQTHGVTSLAWWTYTDWDRKILEMLTSKLITSLIGHIVNISQNAIICNNESKHFTYASFGVCRNCLLLRIKWSRISVNSLDHFSCNIVVLLLPSLPHGIYDSLQPAFVDRSTHNCREIMKLLLQHGEDLLITGFVLVRYDQIPEILIKTLLIWLWWFPDNVWFWCHMPALHQYTPSANITEEQF